MDQATPTTGKTERVRRMFDGIADRYDFANKLMTLGIDRLWRRRTARWVASHSPHKILDVAVGTADLSMELTRQCPALEQITGVDISEGMLQKGREKIAQKAPQANIQLEQANCEALPYEEGTFDAVVSSFGVRNFEHLAQGLEEMCRVTRPGGVIAILELSVPRNPILRCGYTLWTHTFIPLVGCLFARNRGAYNYLPRSVRQVPQYEAFTKMLLEAGYGKAEYKAFSGGIATLYYAIK